MTAARRANSQPVDRSPLHPIGTQTLKDVEDLQKIGELGVRRK